MRRYILKLLLIIIPTLLFFIGSYLIISNTRYDNFGFLKFQIDKLKLNRNKHFNKIYIGDSSGGYSVNTTCDQSSSLNLCLTGSFGYAGQSTFLDIIDDYIKYDTIIVIHSIGVASRKYSDFSYHAPNIHSTNIIKKIKATYFSMREIENIFWFEIKNLLSGPSIKAFNPSDDYIVTENVTKLSQNILLATFDPDQINALKSLDLKLAIKRKEYYIFFSTSLPYDEKYFRKLTNILKINHINHMMNRPFILNKFNKGDAEEHINPKFNCYSTEFYLNLINDQK
jgi:hypothetical protein